MYKPVIIKNLVQLCIPKDVSFRYTYTTNIFNAWGSCNMHSRETQYMQPYDIRRNFFSMNQT